MLIAVYGTLKMDHHNHGILNGHAKFLGEYTIHGYDMYNVGGLFPAVVEGDGIVDVELYAIDSDRIHVLDALEGFSGEGYEGNLYNRVGINLEEGQHQVYQIYLYNGDVSSLEYIEDGEWTHECYGRKDTGIVRSVR
jgi:gamma-glutamylcyclotransferase (GGCT)/AIG2-like uncharacterized protein YtfP